MATQQHSFVQTIGQRTLPRVFRLLLIFPLMHSAYAQYDHCVSVYQAATRNLQIDDSSYNALNTLFDAFCEASGDSRSNDSSAGIDAVIEKIPISFSGRSSDSLQRMKNFCGSYSKSRYESVSSRSLRDTVVSDALKSFNDCIAITQAGVTIQHTSPNGLESTFTFQFGSNLTYELQVIQIGQKIKCHVQHPDTGQRVELDQSSALTFRRNFSVFCNRTSVGDAPQRQYYPRTSVTFASNHGPYFVVYPAEEVEDIEFASAILITQEGFANRLNDLDRTLSDLKSRYRPEIAGPFETKLQGEENQKKKRIVEEDMGSIANRVCFLSRVKFEDIDSPDEDAICEVRREQQTWKLRSELSRGPDAKAYCQAFCISWP